MELSTIQALTMSKSIAATTFEHFLLNYSGDGPDTAKAKSCSFTHDV
jgi:hypothetical protein